MIPGKSTVQSGMISPGLRSYPLLTTITQERQNMQRKKAKPDRYIIALYLFLLPKSGFLAYISSRKTSYIRDL